LAVRSLRGDGYFKLLRALDNMRRRRDELEHKLSVFKGRERELYRKVVESYGRHDVERARIYATELAELRKAMRVVEASKLLVEQMITRLETMMQLLALRSETKELRHVIRDLNALLSGVSTAVIAGSSDIGGEVSELMHGTVQAITPPKLEPTLTDEARSILEEARKRAQERLERALPKP